MFSAHMITKIVTDDVLVSAEAAAERRRLPLMAQVVMRRLSFEHITAARQAEPRRR